MQEKFTPTKRYFMEVAFDGSRYNGWQRQPDAMTVQEVIETTLTRLYGGTPIPVTGSSRTDAGVHACAFAVSFAVPETPVIAPFKLHGALNAMLPDDIKIVSLCETAMDFHARFDAVGKAYSYIINNGEKSPFNHNYTLFVHYKLNLTAMQTAAGFLVGTHDFASFAVNNRQYSTTVRTIFTIDITQFGQLIAITFVGNGFLYKMIRCLVGSLLMVGNGQCAPENIKDILAARSRAAAHNTAPPHGLFLMKVFYNQEVMDNFSLQTLPFNQPLPPHSDWPIYNSGK